MENIKVKPYDYITFTELDDEGMLLNLETKICYSLNEPGVFVWGLINEGNSSHEILEKVQKKYTVEKDVAEENVLKLFNDLIKEKMVEEV